MEKTERPPRKKAAAKAGKRKPVVKQAAADRSRKPFTVRLQPDAYKAVRQYALDTDCALQDVIDQTVGEFFAANKKDRKHGAEALTSDPLAHLSRMERRLLVQCITVLRGDPDVKAVFLSTLKVGAKRGLRSGVAAA